MKILRNSISIISMLLSFTTSLAQEHTLNNEMSVLNWTGKAAFNSYAPTGTLKTKLGNLKLRDGTIESLTIVIDMKSLHHDNKDLKSHLRAKDFFEVKKYTAAAFTLSAPAIMSNDKATLTGDMTIKKTTKQEQLEVVVQRSAHQLKIIFEINVDRTKYGVKFNSPSFFKKLKENAIADDFKIKGEFVFKEI